MKIKSSNAFSLTKTNSTFDDSKPAAQIFKQPRQKKYQKCQGEKWKHCKAKSNLEELAKSSENNFLKVEKALLRHSQQKFLKLQFLIAKHDHKKRKPAQDLTLGKIFHREVDWIQHNIRCMVQIWIKNERHYRIINDYFKQKNYLQDKKQFSKGQSKISKKVDLNSTQTQKKEGSKKKISDPSRNSVHQMVNFDFLNGKQMDKNFEDNLFKFMRNIVLNDFAKTKNYQQSFVEFPLKQFKEKGQSKNVTKNEVNYKIAVEQQSQMIKNIAQKNSAIISVLLCLKRKILIQKQNQLIQKLLKTQKINDRILDNLSFEQKTQIFQEIILNRMKKFQILKENQFRINKNAQIQIQSEQKFIAQCIQQKMANFLLKKNQKASEIKNRAFTIKLSDNQEFQKLNTNQNNLDLKKSQFSEIAHQNLKFNFRQPKPSKRKSEDFLTSLKSDFPLKNQLKKILQQPSLKSLQSVGDLSQPNQNNNNLDIKGVLVQRLSSKTAIIERIQSKTQLQGQLLLEDHYLKKPERQKFDVFSTPNVSKKQIQQDKNEFQMERRKGIFERNHSKIRQFLNILHQKNQTPPITEQQNLMQRNKKKQQTFKSLTTENSPKKKTYEAIQNPKNKNFKNFKFRKQINQTTIQSKKIDDKKTKKKDLQNFVRKGDQFTRLKRVNFQIDEPPNPFRKIIKKIFREKFEIQNQKDTVILREKIIKQFHQLFEAGFFQEGQLSKYKTQIQSLIRSYRSKRMSLSSLRSLNSAKKFADQSKGIDPTPQYKINTKIRFGDPFIFQRLRDIHSNLQDVQGASEQKIFLRYSQTNSNELQSIANLNSKLLNMKIRKKNLAQSLQHSDESEEEKFFFSKRSQSARFPQLRNKPSQFYARLNQK